MTRLLGIEWLKIKKYRTFWVLAGLYMVLLPAVNYVVSNGLIKIGHGSPTGKAFGASLFSQAYSFPEVWKNVGFFGRVFTMLLSILVIILTTNEYTYRTNRQNIIDGWKRMDFFHAKVGLVVVISFLATAYLFFLGIVFGLSGSGPMGDMFKDLQPVCYFFLLSVNYLGFALFLAIWIKRSGMAISLFLLYDLVIENILKTVINWKLPNLSPGNFLPLKASDELLPFPLFKMAQNMFMASSGSSLSTYVVVTLCWCLVYYFAGRTILKRSDW